MPANARSNVNLLPLIVAIDSAREHFALVRRTHAEALAFVALTSSALGVEEMLESLQSELEDLHANAREETK